MSLEKIRWKGAESVYCLSEDEVCLTLSTSTKIQLCVPRSSLIPSTQIPGTGSGMNMRVILARFIAFSYALCMGCVGAVAPISRIPTGTLNDGRRNGTLFCNFNPSQVGITASSDNNGLIAKVLSSGEDFISEAFITDNSGREHGCGSTVGSDNGEVIFAIAIDQYMP